MKLYESKKIFYYYQSFGSKHRLNDSDEASTNLKITSFVRRSRNCNFFQAIFFSGELKHIFVFLRYLYSLVDFVQ